MAEPDNSFEQPDDLLYDPHDPEDTPPHGIRVPDMPAPITDRVRRRGGWLNWLLLGVAALVTVIAAILFVTEPAPTPAPTPTRTVRRATEVPTAAAVTNTPPVEATVAPTIDPSSLGVPADSSVPPDVVAELLRQPARSAPPADGIYRALNAFTIAPARSRSGILQYRVQSGDTLEKIAAQFGVSQDTIIWNNDGIYVNRLFAGDTLTILPEDGVLHKTRTEETIKTIAEAYKVSPFRIIDSEFNPILRNAGPDTLLPAGYTVMVPGGVSEKKAAFWNPGIQVEGAQSGGGGGGRASFGGGSGSCGLQTVTGGTGTLVIPLPPTYVVTRRYTAYHTGIDLSASPGTTVFAADGGTVIFSGWSNWGYGYSVVIAHGNLMTLYGHMLSQPNVSCGQVIGQGQPIGAVGNTGNSTGPHLHFEIRVGEAPVNPEGYMGF